MVDSQYQLTRVHLAPLVVNAVLPQVSNEWEETMFCSSLHVEAEVSFLVASNKTLLILNAPVFAFHGFRLFCCLCHVCFAVREEGGRGSE